MNPLSKTIHHCVSYSDEKEDDAILVTQNNPSQKKRSLAVCFLVVSSLTQRDCIECKASERVPSSTMEPFACGKREHCFSSFSSVDSISHQTFYFHSLYTCLTSLCLETLRYHLRQINRDVYKQERFLSSFCSCLFIVECRCCILEDACCHRQIFHYSQR